MTGKVLYYEGLVQDITERKRGEEELHLQATALKAAANAIIITDATGTIQWINPAFSKLTGYSEHEAIGKNPRILKGGNQDQTFYQDLWRTISSGKVWTGEIINRRKDGTLYPEEMTITPLRNAEGEIVRYIAIKRDITERKRAEEQLRASRQLVEEILNAIPVRVFWKDKNLVYLGCNAAFARDAGFVDPKDVIGKDDYQMGWREQADLYRTDDRTVIDGACTEAFHRRASGDTGRENYHAADKQATSPRFRRRDHRRPRHLHGYHRAKARRGA